MGLPRVNPTLPPLLVLPQGEHVEDAGAAEVEGCDLVPRHHLDRGGAADPHKVPLLGQFGLERLGKPL